MYAGSFYIRKFEEFTLTGAPKVGKSWLVLWLANQVSKGEPVWGLKTEKCGVLYISLEDTFQRMQQRLSPSHQQWSPSHSTSQDLPTLGAPARM